jgi:ABC-type amino acid transport substrate-binding protein
LRLPSSSPRLPVRHSRRVLIGTIAVALASPALATHTGDGSLARVTDRGRLRVITGLAMTPPGPPGTDGRVTDRFNTAVAELIATQLGVSLELVEESSAGRPISRLVTEDIDLLLGAPVTRPVASRLMLSAPYARLDMVVIAPRLPRIREPEQLVGKRVGLMANFINAYGNTLPLPLDVVAVPFRDMQQLEEALRDSRIDAALMPGIIARGIAARSTMTGPLAIHFVAASLAFAAGVRFGAHDLLHAVNSSLSEALLHGELPALFRRETGFTLPPIPPL